ncbi:MAG TPA: MarR family transcriptional regulator [Streptosporangiaceae bacterium]
MIASAAPAGEDPARAAAPQPELSETVARLRRAMRRTARAADPANTLTVAQLELLSSLTEHPRSRPGELARRLHLAPNTVTTLINALAPRGLLVRKAAQDDRRAVTIELTPDGEHAVRTWQAVNAQILRTAVAALPAAQRRALTRAVPVLDALARAIDELADSPS